MIYIVYISNILYFSLTRRKFDYFSVASLSSMIYFMPSLLGFVWYHVGVEDVFIKINGDTLLIHTLVLLSILISSFINDYIIKSTYSNLNYLVDRLFILISSYLSILLYVVFLILNYQKIINGDKMEFGRLYSAVAISIPFCIIMMVEYRSKWILSILLIICAIDMYSGFRAIAAFSIIGSMVVYLHRLGKIVLIRYWRYVIFCIFIFILLIMYKNIGWAVIAGRDDIIINRLTNTDYYLRSMMTSEPFTIQFLLNFVTFNHISYNGAYINQILVSFVPFGDVFDFEYVSITQFINSMFPGLGYGLATNIWAEAYVVGGWILIIAFIITYSAIPFGLNRIYNRSNYFHTKACIALCGAIILFYSHRSGVMLTIVLLKRVIIFYFMISVIRKVLVGLSRKH